MAWQAILTAQRLAQAPLLTQAIDALARLSLERERAEREREEAERERQFRLDLLRETQKWLAEREKAAREYERPFERELRKLRLEQARKELQGLDKRLDQQERRLEAEINLQRARAERIRAQIAREQSQQARRERELELQQLETRINLLRQQQSALQQERERAREEFRRRQRLWPEEERRQRISFLLNTLRSVAGLTGALPTAGRSLADQAAAALSGTAPTGVTSFDVGLLGDVWRRAFGALASELAAGPSAAPGEPPKAAAPADRRIQNLRRYADEMLRGLKRPPKPARPMRKKGVFLPERRRTYGSLESVAPPESPYRPGWLRRLVQAWWQIYSPRTRRGIERAQRRWRTPSALEQYLED